MQFIGAYMDEKLIMQEYFFGPTVGNYVQANLNVNKKPNITDTLKMTLQISRLIDYLHENDIIHCDLSPGKTINYNPNIAYEF